MGATEGEVIEGEYDASPALTSRAQEAPRLQGRSA